MSHNFRFRWNDHVPHISQNFNFLRSEELYCDTTLVSDDGYVIKAHGAVLSATSRYFERVLAEVSSEQHPIIVLQGANFTELSFLLDYIYQGETQIDHNLIKSVLDVAEALEVKGLSKLKNNLSMKKLLAPSPHSSQSLLSPGLETSYSPAPSYNESSPIPASSPPNLKIDEAISECETTDLLLDRATAPTSRFKSPDEEKTDFETSSIKLKHHNTSSFTDYLDQNLGIDLTVSRSNVEEEKHFDSIKEQRKRKKEIEESVPIKKKKFFTKSVTRRTDETDRHKTSKFYNLKRISSMLSAPKHSSNVPSNESPHPRSGVAQKRSKTLDSTVDIELGSDGRLDSQVEVLCGDGALTVSLTTDSVSTTSSRGLNVSKSSAPVSLSLKKPSKNAYTEDSNSLNIKREVAEDKKLNSSDSNVHSRSRFVKQSKNLVSTNSLGSYENLISSYPLMVKSRDPSSTKEGSLTPDEDHLEKNESKCDRIGSYSNRNESNDEDQQRYSCISPRSLFTLPPAKQKQKQSRNSLNLEEKIKVIEAFLEGKSQRQIAHQHGIGKTQVNCIIRKREEILSLYRESLVRGEKLTMKRQRKSEYSSVNDHLIKWYRHMTVAVGLKITTGMLRAKALQIASQLGHQDFKASNGWLSTFKANHNLKFSSTKKSGDAPPLETGNDSSKESDYFEEEAEEENIEVNNSVNTQTSGNDSVSGESTMYPFGLNLGTVRTDSENATGTSGQTAPVSNITIGNPLIPSSSSFPKPPQMSNMTIGTNIAYNLSREHPRPDIAHLSDLHSTSASVNPSVLSHSSHPNLTKPPTEASHSYKSEDPVTYGYDSQGRMNESTARGAADYNYTHYGFPGTYYGYHFLGQYGGGM